MASGASASGLRETVRGAVGPCHGVAGCYSCTVGSSSPGPRGDVACTQLAGCDYDGAGGGERPRAGSRDGCSESSVDVVRGHFLANRGNVSLGGSLPGLLALVEEDRDGDGS